MHVLTELESLAAIVDGGAHLVAGLWVLAAGVTIVFNLDASVVLLTPLYIRIAQRHAYPRRCWRSSRRCRLSHLEPIASVEPDQPDRRRTVETRCRRLCAPPGPADVGGMRGWLDLRRMGVSVSARRYSVVGLKVGLPALVAAAAVVIALP